MDVTDNMFSDPRSPRQPPQDAYSKGDAASDLYSLEVRQVEPPDRKVVLGAHQFECDHHVAQKFGELLAVPSDHQVSQKHIES